MTTKNVIPLADGPSLFFAQRIDGNLNEVIQEHKRFKLPGMVALHRIKAVIQNLTCFNTTLDIPIVQEF